MGQLILCTREGVHIGSRPMDPGERMFYYRACEEREPIDYQGQRYRLITVAWRVPEQDLRCLVVCEGPVPVVYDDD